MSEAYWRAFATSRFVIIDVLLFMFLIGTVMKGNSRSTMTTDSVEMPYWLAIFVAVLATAHPAKFLEVVEQATGRTPELPPQLAGLASKEKQSIVISNTPADLFKTLKDVLL